MQKIYIDLKNRKREERLFQKQEKGGLDRKVRKSRGAVFQTQEKDGDSPSKEEKE